MSQEPANTTQSPTSVSFSLNLEIAGEPVPLRSPEITKLPTKEEITQAKSAAKSALTDQLKGMSFSTPPGFELSLPLAAFEKWLSDKDIHLPDGLTELFDETTFVIYHVSASMAGEASFSFKVKFDPPLGSQVIPGDLFAIDDIGLSITHTPKAQ